jgi:dihydropteroate synthase
MPSKMYENIDNELLEKLRSLELKDIDLNLIILRKKESNPCHLERSIILEDIELEMLDDIKRYMLLRKKRTRFLNELYKKQNLHDQDYIHLKQWYNERKNYNRTDEENEQANKELDEKRKFLLFDLK